MNLNESFIYLYLKTVQCFICQILTLMMSVWPVLLDHFTSRDNVHRAFPY